MSGDPRGVVAQAFPSLLEKFALMFCEIGDRQGLRPGSAPALGARSLLHGSLRGTFELAMPVTLAAEVAANVLGSDVSDPASLESREAVRELASVVSGHLATLLSPTGPACRPSVPEVRVLDGGAWMALLGAEGSQVFMVDDRPMILRLAVERTPR